MSKIKKTRKNSVRGNLDVEVFVGETISVATVKLVDSYVGVGEAKRAPGDPWDPNIGTTLSLGRALRDLGDQMLEAADGR